MWSAEPRKSPRSFQRGSGGSKQYHSNTETFALSTVLVLSLMGQKLRWIKKNTVVLVQMKAVASNSQEGS